MPSNQPAHTVLVSEAASAVGVNSHTIRRWAEWHSAHLSPGANPPAGQAKRFAGRDIEVLRHVKALRNEGLQTDAINEKLSGLTFAEIEVIDTLRLGSIDSEASRHVPKANIIPFTQPQPGAIQQIDVSDTALIFKRLDALEQNTRERIYFVAIGIALGLGLAVVFELAAIVASRVH